MQVLNERLHIDTLSSALDVLTSMITPALLLSACGTFIISTSNRLNHVVDRVRGLGQPIEESADHDRGEPLIEERRDYLYGYLARLIARAALLQRALTILYVAGGLFLATSVAIGLLSIAGSSLTWLPVVLGLLGAAAMFVASMILIREAWISIHLLREETAHLLKLIHRRGTKQQTPPLL